MIRYLRIVGFIVLQMIGLTAYGQYFTTGSDPGKIHWKQINTNNFQLIFPEDWEANAVKLAATLESVYDYGYKTLGSPPRKISVIVHSHSSISNGLVAWAPQRMELYPIPDQRIYPQDWLEQLAIHEFRHVVQMDKIAKELPFIFKAILGEQAAVAAIGAYVPLWFMEGDAVVAETALTETGRGRNPAFLKELKAQALQKGLYSYDKATLGSYKDFVPNRYNFGWWMVGSMRKEYGADVWDKALSNVARVPLSLNPINRSLKQQTGMKKESLYESLFSSSLQEWKKEQLDLVHSPLTILTASGKFHTNYTYPQVQQDGSIIAYKESLDDVGRIVRIADGRETVLFTPGNLVDESFSVSGDNMLWIERRAHPRWENADRNVVVIYDLNKKNKQTFSLDENLFSPALSPKSAVFAAVKIDRQNQNRLALYHTAGGGIVREFEVGANDYIFAPCWDNEGENLYFIGLSAYGKYFGQLNVNSGEYKQLTDPVRYDLRALSFQSGKLWFTSAKTGIDNIFSLDVTSGKLVQETGVPFGADYPCFRNENLYFCNYTALGYQLVKIAAKNLLNKENEDSYVVSNLLADSLARQEGGPLNFEKKSAQEYEIKPYRKIANLFNFHSWNPAYVNLNSYEIRPGLSLFSQNKLGTAITVLGYDYDATEKTGKYKSSFEYSGFFPVFKAEFGYGKRNLTYKLISKTDTTTRKFYWNELSFDLGARVPLVFQFGKYTQFLQPRVEYSYKNRIRNNTFPQGFKSGYHHSLSFGLQFQNRIRRSSLDLMPRWGQTVDVVYETGLGGGQQIGDVKALVSYLYFPGLTGQQGLRIYNGYQQKRTEREFPYSDIVRFPRGSQRIANTDLYTLAIDYAVPLAYPDLSLSRLFYLKRLRSNLFYDFSSLKGNTYNRDGSVHSIYEKYLTSVGLELIGDGHFLRLPAPVSVGARSIYLPDTEDFRFEFLLSVSFNQI